MQQLKKEIQLLKKFTEALQNENKTKSSEIDFLSLQLANLGKETDGKNDRNINKSNKYCVKCLEDHTKTHCSLKQEVNLLSSKCERIDAYNQTLKSQIYRLTSQLQKSQQIILIQQQSNCTLNQRILFLIKENQYFQERIKNKNSLNQLSVIKEEEDCENGQVMEFRIKELQFKVQQYESQLSQKNKYIKVIEKKLGEDKMKYSDDREIKLIMSKNLEIEKKIIMMERQKQDFVRKLKDMEGKVRQNVSSSQDERKKQLNEEFEKFMNIIDLKDEQIRTSNSIVNNLKDHIGFIEKKVEGLSHQLQDCSYMLQQQRIQMQNMKNIHEYQMERVINDCERKLLETHNKDRSGSHMERNATMNSQIMEENQELSRVIQHLQEENNRIYQLLEDNKTFSEENSNNYISRGYKKSEDESRRGSDLKKIMEELKIQLVNVHNNFKKINTENSRAHQSTSQGIPTPKKQDSKIVPYTRRDERDYSLELNVNSCKNANNTNKSLSRIAKFQRSQCQNNQSKSMSTSHQQYRSPKYSGHFSSNFFGGESFDIISPSFAEKENNSLEKRVSILRQENLNLKKTLQS